MTDPSPEVAGLVAGLTRAQRYAVVALTEEPQFARRRWFSAQAAFNMVHMGIVGIGFDQGLLRDTYYLTPLGLQVRAALIAEQSL